MKPGSMVMTLRPRFRVLSGSHPVLLVPKKHGSRDPASRWCWLFFWPWWNCPSWVRTSEHNSELWILQGLVRAFDQRCVCETAWEMGQWFHPAPQQCTLPHVTPGTAVSVWREHYRVSSPAVFLRPGAVWLLALPQSQSGHERQTLWIDSGHQGSCDSTAGHTHEGGLPALLCRVARAVGQVCSEWGGVFWGGLVAVCLSVINWF